MSRFCRRQIYHASLRFSHVRYSNVCYVCMYTSVHSCMCLCFIFIRLSFHFVKSCKMPDADCMKNELEFTSLDGREKRKKKTKNILLFSFFPLVSLSHLLFSLFPFFLCFNTFLYVQWIRSLVIREVAKNGTSRSSSSCFVQIGPRRLNSLLLDERCKHV